MEEMRLDALLVQRGLSPSREKAKKAIQAGNVLVDGKIQNKPSFSCPLDADVTVNAPAERYVSRGGYKLERALELFSVDCSDLCCLDLGASTGGFTDCLLQHGARRVIAVDVGTNQLAASLRADSRVISLEKTDFRALRPEMFPEPVSLVTGDLSFISLRLLFPLLSSFSDGRALLLVKPQFEAGRADVGKKGIVRSPAVHERVLREICENAVLNGLSVAGLAPSPIRGGEGNVEYLLSLDLNGEKMDFVPDYATVVRQGMQTPVSY